MRRISQLKSKQNQRRIVKYLVLVVLYGTIGSVSLILLWTITISSKIHSSHNNMNKNTIQQQHEQEQQQYKNNIISNPKDQLIESRKAFVKQQQQQQRQKEENIDTKRGNQNQQQQELQKQEQKSEQSQPEQIQQQIISQHEDKSKEDEEEEVEDDEKSRQEEKSQQKQSQKQDESQNEQETQDKDKQKVEDDERSQQEEKSPQNQQKQSQQAESQNEQETTHDKDKPNENVHQEDQQQERRQQQQQKQQHPNAKGTIAYATVLTDCNKGLKMDVPFQILEGAAVLQHSVHQNSIHNPTSGSQYDYELYLIYHPNAASCAPDLEQFGFRIMERNFPVDIEKMKSHLLRTKIRTNGCCGERELIKLEAYTLIQHPLVVLLDLDVLFLKPLDPLFNLMLEYTPLPTSHMMEPERYNTTTTTTNQQLDLLYTVDYGMAPEGENIKPVQGGFVVLRPNQTVYTDYVAIVQEGDFRDNGGWGGKSGRYWGAMTFQGLTPYYFIALYPHRSLELNWCYYDNMCSPSRGHNGKCLTKREPCMDCKATPSSDIYLFHYTVCQKPWTCQNRMGSLCDAMHHEWFQTRSSLEKSWGRSGIGNSTFKVEHFNGYCAQLGPSGYIPIAQPYLQATAN